MIRIYLLLMFFLWGQTNAASMRDDSAVGTEPDLIEMVNVIQDFMDRVDLMLSYITEANNKDANLCKQELGKLSLRWTKYYLSIENIVLEEEEVLNMVMLLNDRIKELENSIDRRLSFFRQNEIFQQDLVSLHDFLKEYDEMEKLAVSYSLTEQTAGQLEDLKAREEILFEDASVKFGSLKSILNEFTELSDTKDEIEQLFADISVKSQKIKSAEYKPFLERIKDYLYSLAAVALLLMFVNMIQTKISAAKALKKNAKALKALQKQNSEEYPTI
ncbi:hypothetical protein [Parabacteroides sp.]